MKFGSGGRRWLAGAIGGLLGVTMATLTAVAAPDHRPSPAAHPAVGITIPQRTTAVFGDWTMACIQPTSGAKQCEASLTVQNQQHQIILVFAIGRTAKDQPQKAVIQVPINIRTAESVRLMVGGDPVLIPFTQCNRLGCFAQLELKNNSLIRRLRAHNVGTPGRIAWHDSTNAEVVAPFSTRGFSAAMDALAAADHGKP